MLAKRETLVCASLIDDDDVVHPLLPARSGVDSIYGTRG